MLYERQENGRKGKWGEGLLYYHRKSRVGMECMCMYLNVAPTLVRSRLILLDMREEKVCA